MSRYTRSDDRRPFRFDPDQRARDFTRKRKRRGHGQQHQTVERRVADLETYSYLSTHVAIQPPANSRIQVVSELPEATQLDIGRQLIVRSPAAVRDVLYIGMQQSGGEVVWVQWTSSYEGGGGEPVDNDSVSLTFVKNIPLGVSPYGCHATADYVYFTRSGGTVVRRYDRASGAITSLTFPSSSGVNLRGLYVAEDGKAWIAAEDGAYEGHVYYWNGTTTTSTTLLASQAFFGMAYNPINDSMLAAGFTADVSDNYWPYIRRLNKTTLATLDSVGGAGAGLGSELAFWGIAVDSQGFVYGGTNVGAGQQSIYQLNGSLDYLNEFDGAGSVYGAVGSPRGMAFDADDRLFVADSSKNRVQVFTPDGLSIGVFGVGGVGAGQFNQPYDVTIHGTTLWVADRLNQRLSEWTINS